MLVVEAQRSRLLMGRLESGEHLMEGLVSLCKRHQVETASIRASGIVTDISLGEYCPPHKNYQTSFTGKGPFTLCSLEGNISLMGDELIINAHALCAWSSQGQSMVTGGLLQSATVLAVDFTLTVSDEVALIRGHDKKTGLPLWKEFIQKETPNAAEAKLQAQPTGERAKETDPMIPAPKKSRPAPSHAPSSLSPPQPSAPIMEAESEDVQRIEQTVKKSLTPPTPGTAVPPGAQWEEVLSHSQELDDEVDDDGDVRRGDILLHPRFGKCKVVQVEDNLQRCTVLNESHNRMTLSLAVLRLVHQGEDEDGHQIYKVKIGRSR